VQCSSKVTDIEKQHLTLSTNTTASSAKMEDVLLTCTEPSNSEQKKYEIQEYIILHSIGSH